MDPECGVEVAACRCEPGDGFLLCSDGLNHELEDDAIARAWRSARRREDSADSLCRTLIDQANQTGGRDNINVLALHLRAQGRSTNQST
jgi:serine/threonine protein phosphatase PrpC